MIFAEDFVHEKTKKNIMLSEVKVGDEIFAFDIINSAHIWTKVTAIKKTGERDLVNITFKNTHHIRMCLDQRVVNKRNDFETIKDIAFDVDKREGFHQVRVMNDGFSEVGDVRKYGKFTTMQLEVDNIDNNFFVNGVLVKCA